MKKLTTKTRIAPALLPFVEAKKGAMPVALARVLSIFPLGNVEVIHPSPRDPVVLNDGRAIALWLEL